jgi:DNA (cytosine-5)-methyltransferase 1
MSAYYNENDPFCVAWLRELIKRGLIADGTVDDRSIVEVKGDDLKGFEQCHFFAGIGGWSYALRLAGWPDDRPVWTGSCPCQPFSAAGQRKGFDDSRHLWPQMFRLIRESKPERVFGEQVASALGWLDLVSGDLEGEGYSVGAAIVGAHSVGAPHIRQRIYWVAESLRSGAGHASRQGMGTQAAIDQRDGDLSGERLRIGVEGSFDDGVGQSAEGRRGPGRSGEKVSGEESCGKIERSVLDGLEHSPLEQMGIPRRARKSGSSVGDHDDTRSQRRCMSGADRERDGSDQFVVGQTSAAIELGITDRAGSQSGDSTAASTRQGDSTLSASFWSECDWLPCIDGKSRPVEPGTFPLAHGIPGRVGRLRGYGNAIVPQAAEAFISAYMEIM